MAELTTLARPYAKAAFESALAAKQLQEWSDALALVSAVSSEDNMQAVLASPGQTSEQKSALFIEVCGDKLSPAQQNFIKVLADNKRLVLLPQISALFELYKANQEKSVEVNIASAFEISPELEQKLAKALSAKLDREVQLQTSIDKSLLGGALIRAGDTVIDGSVRGRLAKLAAAMTA